MDAPLIVPQQLQAYLDGGAPIPLPQLLEESYGWEREVKHPLPFLLWIRITNSVLDVTGGWGGFTSHLEEVGPQSFMDEFISGECGDLWSFARDGIDAGMDFRDGLSLYGEWYTQRELIHLCKRAAPCTPSQ